MVGGANFPTVSWAGGDFFPTYLRGGGVLFFGLSILPNPPYIMDAPLNQCSMLCSNMQCFLNLVHSSSGESCHVQKSAISFEGSTNIAPWSSSKPVVSVPPIPEAAQGCKAIV